MPTIHRGRTRRARCCAISGRGPLPWNLSIAFERCLAAGGHPRRFLTGSTLRRLQGCGRAVCTKRGRWL